MKTDVPVMLGSVNDLVDGFLEVGYAVLHALRSDHSIYGKATLYDRPFQEAQLKVERVKGLRAGSCDDVGRGDGSGVLS